MDLRKRRSQESLQKALTEHLQSKSLDEITIGALTKTAGVSRQTFYSNFDSKESILLSRIELLFQESWAAAEEVLADKDLKREEFVEACIRLLLGICDAEQALMHAAFTGQAGFQCLSLLKNIISRLISGRILFYFKHNFDAQQLDDVSNFYAGAIIGSMQTWLSNNSPDKDPEVLVQCIGRLIPYGIDGYSSQLDGEL